jgi:glycosyltransferase involved in cell wall biosynthesis
MSQPLAACLMPTAGRIHLLPRAVRSFRQQTYQNRMLVLLSNDPEEDGFIASLYNGDNIITHAAPPGKTLGHYRNVTAQLAVAAGAKIAVHFDDDDWSHPERVAEQVAALGSSDRDCVGYRTGLFWDEQKGKAWMYHNGLISYCLGNSMCYRLTVWDRIPFPEINRGEDWQWLRQVDSIGLHPESPRIIAAVHEENAERYPIEQYAGSSPSWQRAAEWDELCRREMALSGEIIEEHNAG